MCCSTKKLQGARMVCEVYDDRWSAWNKRSILCKRLDVQVELVWY